MANNSGATKDRPWAEDPLYAPFERHDHYGELGLGSLSLFEKLRLAVLACTVVPVKLLGGLFCLLAYYLICRFAFLVPKPFRTEFIAACGKIACRSCLFCLGFYQIQWIPVEPGKVHQKTRPAVIVSNHCGWSDILVHMSHSFPAFVARDKTKHMPIIGIIR